MAAFDDAQHLIQHAERNLAEIRKAYGASLEAKTINATLRVEIKNLVENLRSALDFAAHGLFEKYGSSNKPRPNIYFPYATANQDRAAFEKSGRVEACIPGIRRARPDVVEALLEMQHFGARGHTWLPVFMDLTNENKHERLTPQVRRETKQLKISAGGVSMTIGDGTRASVGQGASVIIGGRAVIRGGQSFDVDHPPRVEGGLVEKITWVSFNFETNGQPVIPLLEAGLKGVTEIVAELAGK